MLASGMDKLRNLLSCNTYNGAQHTHILIEEADAAAKLKKVTLLAPKGDWISFDPDKGRGTAALMSPLFSVGRVHDHHRACDSVIMVNRNGQLTIVYLDLKSGNGVSANPQSGHIYRAKRHQDD